MSNHSIAQPYAQAIFEMAQEQVLLDQIESDMNVIRDLLANCTEFELFIENPLVTRDARDTILNAVFATHINELTLRFLRFVSAKNRLAIVASIMDVLRAMILDHRGILESTVVSARPLSDAQLADISAKLKTKFHKEIQTTASVDESLIGGFRVQVGDAVYDYSVLNQLDNLKHNIIHA